MAKYLLIESRDPYECNEVNEFYSLASELTKAGNDVTMYLVQNGVLATRGDKLTKVNNVKILADDLSLRERGIADSKISKNIEVSNIAKLVDILVDKNVKPLWH